MPLLVEVDMEEVDLDVTGDREVVDGKPVELGCRLDSKDDDEESGCFSMT